MASSKNFQILENNNKIDDCNGTQIYPLLIFLSCVINDADVKLLYEIQRVFYIYKWYL